MLTPASTQVLLGIARRSIYGVLRLPNPPELGDDSALRERAGCFVSLHRKETHLLRGCVGVMQSEQSLADAARYAAEQVLQDPRFAVDPVTAAEASQLEIEVTVLSPLRAAASPLDFDPKQHGIYLTIHQRCGCFLPQVGRETGWTREQLLQRLCTEKLGMAGDAWRLPIAKLQTFTAQIVGPEPLIPVA